MENPQLEDNSDEDFDQYLIDEMVKNTDANQKNNKKKNKHRFSCEKNLIAALLFICLNIFPFGYNYTLKMGEHKNVILLLNSEENKNLIDRLILKNKKMADDKNSPTPAPKPTPPPSQVIKEGQDPRIRTHVPK